MGIFERMMGHARDFERKSGISKGDVEDAGRISPCESELISKLAEMNGAARFSLLFSGDVQGGSDSDGPTRSSRAIAISPAGCATSPTERSASRSKGRPGRSPRTSSASTRITAASETASGSNRPNPSPAPTARMISRFASDRSAHGAAC